jgi:DNA-directed RNA polymerase subunit RPC12/RpoP
MDFLRKCPQCGRRFHVKLVDKKLAKVLDRRIVRAPPQTVKTPGSPLGPMRVVGKGEPVIIDTEEFLYVYRCKHCGHEWSEAHTEKHVKKPGTTEE